MKDLIIKILSKLPEGTTHIDGQFDCIKLCMNFNVQFDDFNWQTTCQYIEIVQTLQRMGIIRGHDAATKQVYTYKGNAKNLWEAVNTVGEEALFRELFAHHLQGALNILNYDGDIEDLVAFYPDFNLIEKCAWLHKMAQLPNIQSAHARNIANNLLNHHDGTVSFFPASVPLEVQIFAKWLQRNPCNLFTLCNPVAASPAAYVTTATN